MNEQQLEKLWSEMLDEIVETGRWYDTVEECIEALKNETALLEGLEGEPLQEQLQFVMALAGVALVRLQNNGF